MDKYKICPNCGTHNNPTAFQCTECDEDLTSVRISDENTELLSSDLQSDKKTVRICEECGAENNPASRKCAACGEDISYILPTEKLCSKNAKYKLTSLDGTYEFDITADSHIIGRENDMQEYLSSKSYVSRRHAKISVENGLLFITNLSKTNFTYINNKKLIGEEKAVIKSGDEIGLGGMVKNNQRQEQAAYFIVGEI